VMVTSEHRALGNADTLKYFESPSEIDAQLFQIQGINGPLIDWRDSRTDLVAATRGRHVPDATGVAVMVALD